MVDLTTICGDAVLHASITKKRIKAQQKLDALIAKANEKIQPLQEQIEKYDAMLCLLGADGKFQQDEPQSDPTA